MDYEIAWRPGIGDPTVMGWVTVVAYFVAAWLCMQAFNTEKRGPIRPWRKAVPSMFRVLRKHWPRPPLPARRAALWVLVAMIFVALGINKQLDLQTLLTEVGKKVAHSGGWYEQRRVVQAIFVALVGGFGLMAIWLLFRLTQGGQLRDFRLPLAGLAVVVAFVVARAASFHHMDVFIGTEVLGLRMNTLFELGGVLVVAAGAIQRLRHAPAPPRPR